MTGNNHTIKFIVFKNCPPFISTLVSIGNIYYNSCSNKVNHSGTKATHWKICDDRGVTIMACENKGKPVSNKSKLWMKKHLNFLLLVNRHQLLPLFLAKVDELLLW